MLSKITPIILVYILVAYGNTQANLTVQTSTKLINTPADYTLTIVFTSTQLRSYLSLTFPSQLNLNTISTLTLNSVILNSSQFSLYTTNNSILISQSVSNTVSIVVGNVTNPSSALSTFAFTMSTNITADTTSPFIYNLISYQAGSLSSCLYTFSGTTEQSNSVLTASVVLGDSLPIGNNYIKIGYPVRWGLSNQKSLTYGSPTISCSYSLNLGTTLTTISSCTYDSTTITATIPLSVSISSGSTLSIKIQGINNPPTVQTITSNNYIITTLDPSNYLINTLNNCNISDTTVSSATGTFTVNGLAINSNYNNPQVNFSSTTPVTFQVGDTVEVSYTVTTVTCSNTFYVIRNTPMVWSLTSNANNLRIYTYTTSSDNSLSSSTFQLYLACSFTTPPSATPSPFLFTFKRNSSQYLRLTSSYTSTPQTIASTSFAVFRSTTSAIVSCTYTFSLIINQPLSSQAMVSLNIPSAIGMGTFNGLSSCSASIDSVPTVLSSCSYILTTSISLNLIFNRTTTIPSGSTLQLVISSLFNPNYAYTTYSIGASTYYNASDSSSLVESSPSLTSLQYTTYSTTNMAINPSTYTVFQNVNSNLSYVNQVYLPSGTTFTLTFPSALTTLTFNSTIFTNGTFNSINQSTLSTSAPYSLTITYYQVIPIGTNFTIPLRFTTPANLATYGPINLTTTHNSLIYSLSNSLLISVTQTSSINTAISLPTSSPQGQYPGANTQLTFSLTSFIAHSTPNFTLLLTIPTGTFFSSNGSCAGSCRSSYSMVNATTINLTINNSVSSNSSNYNYSVTLGTFTNHKYIGASGLWNFMTFNNDGSQVATGTSTYTVTLPSPITGALSKSYAYYRANTNLVVVAITLTNSLATGDYLQLQFGPDTYLNASATVSCPLATCSLSSQSTSNTPIVVASPNQNQLSTTGLILQFSNLISSTTSLYASVSYFNISTYNSNSQLIDTGHISYNVSCGQFSTNNCKQCLNNGTCTSCYTSQGMNMLNGRCVSNCTLETQYFSFNQTGSCLSCSNNCLTCFNETACRSCNTGNYYYQNYSCLGACDINNGFYITTDGLNCLLCFDQLKCLECSNGSSTGCTRCSSSVLQQGQCTSGCTIANTYLRTSDATCQTCNIACTNCTGPTNVECLRCNVNYYNYNGYCLSICPTGTVAILSTQVCGCSGQCITCEGNQTYCLQCYNNTLTNQPQWSYQGSCISSCPTYSYQSGTSCLSCPSGCFNCSATTCFNCDSNKYIYNDRCYQDCNSLGLQYDGDSTSAVKKCVLCPNGCDTCSNVVCSSCLSGFSLQNSSCVELCVVLGSCQSPIPERILPIPGLLTVAVWALIVIFIKLINKKLYGPYSLLFVHCIAQFGIVIATIVVLSQSQTSQSATQASRLLYGIDYSYRNIIASLLLGAIVLNYLTNIVYIFIFCRYLWPLLNSPKQIDYITNAFVLFFATVTNYRLSMITYSHMFSKPFIPIDTASRLTPINYLTITTLVLSLLPLSACIILVYKQTTGTNLFMLGIDLLLLLAVGLVISIWMVAVPKPQSYFSQQIKKNNMQEIYHDQFRTEEDINNQKNQKNVSFSKLIPNTSTNHFDRNATDVAQDQLGLQPKTEMEGHGTIMAIANEHQFVVQAEEKVPRVSQTARKNNNNNNSNKVQHINFDSEEVEEVIQFDQPPFKQQTPKQSDLASEALQSKKTKRTQRESPKAKHHARYINQEDQHLGRKVRETANNFSKEKTQKQSEPFAYSGSEIVEVREGQFSQDRDVEEILGGGMDYALSRGAKNKVNTQRQSTNIKYKHKPRRTDRQSQSKMFMKKQRHFDSNPSQDFSGDANLQSIMQSKARQGKTLDYKVLKDQIHRRGSRDQVGPGQFNTPKHRIEPQELDQ